MYGYLRAYPPELKMRERAYYQAVYCGLCRTMGRLTGQRSRLTLTYDFTFFALVRMALTGEPVVIRPRACVRRCFRRRPTAEPNRALEFCAGLSAILAYHKLRDDLRDERGAARAKAALLGPYMAGLRRRAVKRGYGTADAEVRDALDALSRMEALRPASVDEPADLFGRLMGRLLSLELEGDRAVLAEVIGRRVGRWVYIMDAADDFAEDVRRRRYNPFACLYAGDGSHGALTELPDERKREIRAALLGELREVERAFDLLDLDDPRNPDPGGILSNILYIGMPGEAERVLFGAGGTGRSGKRRALRRARPNHEWKVSR